MKILVTVAEAAEMLSVSPKTVYELASGGTFTKRYVNGSRRNFRLEAEQVRDYALNLPTEPAEPEDV